MLRARAGQESQPGDPGRTAARQHDASSTPSATKRARNESDRRARDVERARGRGTDGADLAAREQGGRDPADPEPIEEEPGAVAAVKTTQSWTRQTVERGIELGGVLERPELDRRQDADLRAQLLECGA